MISSVSWISADKVLISTDLMERARRRMLQPEQKSPALTEGLHRSSRSIVHLVLDVLTRMLSKAIAGLFLNRCRRFVGWKKESRCAEDWMAGLVEFSIVRR